MNGSEKITVEKRQSPRNEGSSMLDRLFRRFARKPSEITLQVGGRTLNFHSVRDFEFALASRTEVPSTKIAQLMRLKDDELLAEIEGIRDVKRRFVSVLLRSITKDDSISHSLRMLDATLFSNDHKWRKFIAALNADTTVHDAFKRVALVKYLQYLNARHEVVRSIYRERHQADGQLPEALGDSGAFVNFASVDEIGRLSPKAASGEVTRLPKGEKVPLTVRPGDEVYLFLSKQQYTLKRGETLTLIDEDGIEQVLHAGRNVIGRAPDADVRVGTDKKDISRRHLVIELPDDEMALLTDTSSYGTFVEDKALKG
ncbi:MAG: FHA domain-containing protein [Xanthomonadaceae bacterium]|nr:FHA domain-containing protein [Xanthomonadaceae bacterium]